MGLGVCLLCFWLADFLDEDQTAEETCRSWCGDKALEEARNKISSFMNWICACYASSLSHSFIVISLYLLHWGRHNDILHLELEERMLIAI